MGMAMDLLLEYNLINPSCGNIERNSPPSLLAALKLQHIIPTLVNHL
jgi:hypothetical protein